MTNIETLTSLMRGLYGAEVLPHEDAVNWVSDDEDLIIGYSFPDDKKAFFLLSMSDRRLLTEEQKKVCDGLRKYPFENAAAVVYRDNRGNTNMRVVNGIAGALGRTFTAWKEWEETSSNN